MKFGRIRTGSEYTTHGLLVVVLILFAPILKVDALFVPILKVDGLFLETFNSLGALLSSMLHLSKHVLVPSPDKLRSRWRNIACRLMT